MTGKNSNKSEVYNVANCFRFDEEDSPKSNASNLKRPVTCERIIEFRPDKPYRLALYVQPVLRRRNVTNSTAPPNLSRIKKDRGKENVTKANVKRKLPKCDVEVALFEEESEAVKREKKMESVNIEKYVIKKSSNRVLKNSEKSNKNESEPAEKKPLKELDVSSLPKTKQRKVRKSYEKKFKEYADSEKVPEPPSDKILKELDMKKITRSKAKKPNKEEKEFEEWAENMNSAFDEIDKFDLSINYD